MAGSEVNGEGSGGVSSSRKATHTHLGLRPKKKDSLHTRIRTTHPQPKHVSRIVDITRPTSPAWDAPLSASSRSSRNGSISTPTGTAHPSREASGADETELDEGSYDAGSYEVNNADEDEDEIVTTDIGIYDNTVYDEYLGYVLGRTRRLLIRILEWETPILAKHQAIVRGPKLDLFFVYTSLVGSHSFFLLFLPVSFWLINGPFSRGLVNILAFGVYFSSAIKDALCVPRPYSPPVTRLVIGTFHLEYGFPSTHATNCISVVLYCYFWLDAIRPFYHASSAFNSWAWEVGLIFYAVSVVYGRIYSGMHSIMDCLAGCVLGALIAVVQWRNLELFERLMTDTGPTVPLVMWSAGLAMVIVHPQPLDDCPCFEDAIAFLSVVIGIVCARPLAIRFGWLTPSDGLELPAIFQSKLQRMVRDPVGTILPLSPARQAYTQAEALDFTYKAAKVFLVLATGIPMILLTRFLVKTVCRVLLPPVFRFVQGTFGFVLPRRHYTTSTEFAALQKADREGRQDADDDDGKTVAGDGTGGRTRTHKRQVSITNGTVRHVSKETEGLRNRMRSHSLQNDRHGENTVKFTTGHGNEIPVPFTHPNTQLPGDGLSERIVGALSNEENQRQRRVSNPATALRPTLGGGEVTVQPAFEIAHYDVDVLTKVLVYSAIGFVSACGIPASMTWIGLLPV